MISMSVHVGADRRLVIDLPSTTPTGPANVMIVPQEHSEGDAASQAVRARLLAAHFLMTDIHAADAMTIPQDQDLLWLGEVGKGARCTEDLLDDERGAR